jgi:hypothetical protein
LKSESLTDCPPVLGNSKSGAGFPIRIFRGLINYYFVVSRTVKKSSIYSVLNGGGKLPPDEGKARNPRKAPLIPCDNIQASRYGGGADQQIMGSDADTLRREAYTKARVGPGGYEIKRQYGKPRQDGFDVGLATGTALRALRPVNPVKKLGNGIGSQSEVRLRVILKDQFQIELPPLGSKAGLQ